MSPSIAGATTTGAPLARHRGRDRVTRQPGGHRGQPVGGRRRDDDRVGRVGDDDVPDALVGQQVQHVGLDRVARQCGERQRADEAGRRRGEHDRDVGALGTQQADQLDGLVGGDRPRDADPDESPGEPAAVGVGHDRPSSRRSPPVTSAWRMARPLRVSSGSMASTSGMAVTHGAADSPPVRMALMSRGSTPARSASSRRVRASRVAGQPLVADDRPGLDGAHRVAADDPIGHAQLDPRQLRGPGGQGLQAQLQPGRDGAADVGPVGVHAVERGRRAEVHDDRGRAVQAGGGERVDQPVGPDLARAGRPGRRWARSRPWRRSAAGPGGRRPSRRGGQRGHDRGAGDRRDVAEGRGVEAPASPARATSRSSLVARGIGRHSPGRDERAGPHEARRDVRVADVDDEQHGRDDTRRSRVSTGRAVRYHRATRRPTTRPPVPEETDPCRARRPPSSS